MILISFSMLKVVLEARWSSRNSRYSGYNGCITGRNWRNSGFSKCINQPEQKEIWLL